MNRLPRARKRFGQHFLEPAWATRLIDLVQPEPEDTFVEIGPGRGVLTARLAPRVAQLIGVEIDRDLSAALVASMPAQVSIVTADVLETDLRALVDPDRRPARVIGNLPYNVSSPVLFQILAAADEGRTFRDATVMLQAEVADRLAATPGSRDYGALAVQASLIADIDIILTLPPGAFRPPPKVHSSVVRLRFRPASADVGDAATFQRLVRGVFLHRRKMILNGLASMGPSLKRDPAEVIAAAGIDPRKRPEALNVDEFARLSRAVL